MGPTAIPAWARAVVNLEYVDGADVAQCPSGTSSKVGGGAVESARQPWIPLDHTPTEMARFTSAMQRYFPDDRIDLYAQTGWISALMLEHALRQMGTNISRQNLIDTMNSKFVNWNTQFGPVENFSTSVHAGPFESALMAVQGAASANWRLVTVHDAING